MKQLLILSIAILTFGCAPVKTSMSGLDNISYLEIYGTPSKYKNGVSVSIDGNTPVNMRVNKKGKDLIKPYRYEIPTGTHKIHIYSENTEILSETIFTSSQITKKIILP